MTRPWDPDAHDAAYAAALRSRNRWRVLGIVLATLIAVAGLALVAIVVSFAIAMNSYGSNK